MNPVPFILLAVSLPLLLGGCGERPVGEVKSEEPVAETNPELEGVNWEELEEREYITYLKGSDTPYTGKAYGLHENGQKKAEANFKDGKEEGLSVHWYKNGQKFREGTFEDGKPDGPATEWDSNGKKRSEGNYKDGRLDGLWVGWHENGKKASEVNYKDGKQDGLSLEFHGNGQKRSEENFKDGKFEGLSVKWYENGQKQFEANFKDGIIDGLWTEWHKNGQKKGELNIKDGKIVEGSEKHWNSKGEPVAEVKPELEGVNYDELEEREGIRYLKGSGNPYTGKTFVLHENGQKKGEGAYKDGKKDEPWLEWYSNGQKMWKINYKNDKLDGLLLGWHENGQKSWEGNWKDGKEISTKYWNSKGEPVDSQEEAYKK